MYKAMHSLHSHHRLVTPPLAPPSPQILIYQPLRPYYIYDPLAPGPYISPLSQAIPLYSTTND